MLIWQSACPSGWTLPMTQHVCYAVWCRLQARLTSTLAQLVDAAADDGTIESAATSVKVATMQLVAKDWLVSTLYSSGVMSTLPSLFRRCTSVGARRTIQELCAVAAYVLQYGLCTGSAIAAPAVSALCSDPQLLPELERVQGMYPESLTAKCAASVGKVSVALHPSSCLHGYLLS